MKKKITTLFLILFTISLWSFIGMKVFLFIDNHPTPTESKFIPEEEVFVDIKKDYILSLAYSDPFSQELIKKPITKRENVGNKKALPSLEPKKLDCIYKGTFKNEKGLIVAIEFNQKNLLIRKGVQNYGIRLLEAFEDSARIKYRGQSYYIYKKGQL